MFYLADLARQENRKSEAVNMISKISFRFYVTDPLLRYYLLRCFEEETMPSLDR